MKFEKYSLYQVTDKLDELGNPVNDSIFIDDIEVSVFTSSINEVREGVLYQVKSMTGLTKYSNMNENYKYYLLKGNKKLNIKNMIFGRFTKFNLVEVLK